MIQNNHLGGLIDGFLLGMVIIACLLAFTLTVDAIILAFRRRRHRRPHR
jgi:hypothetical protein